MSDIIVLYSVKYKSVLSPDGSAPTVGTIKAVNEPKTNRTDSTDALSALFECMYSQP